MGSLFVFLIIFQAATGYAHSINSGDIRGTLTDPSGGLPGTTVSDLNMDTGVSRGFVTDNSGLYDTGSILPGSLQTYVTAPGFETFVRGPITIFRLGFATVNAQLNIGAQNQQVTVTADVPLRQTDSGEQSTTLESKSMSQWQSLQP
jgi:hypothetical protein